MTNNTKTIALIISIICRVRKLIINLLADKYILRVANLEPEIY
jgi:hypothetical protein